MATERVISSRVVGSSNPIAKKFRSISGSIKGLGCGCIMLVIGLVLIYLSVFGVKEYSKILEALPLNTATDVTADAEIVKIQGEITALDPVSYTYQKCADTNCFGSITTVTTEPSYYVSVQKQRFEIKKYTHTETRTKDVGGSEVEEQVEVTEYKEEWVTKDSDILWAELTLDEKIKVTGSDSTRLLLDLSEKTVNNVKIENLEALNNYGQVASSAVGSTRLVYSYLPIPEAGTEFIVTGSLVNNTISAGDPFIITTLSNDELIKTLGEEENFTRLAYAIGSWVLTFLGLTMIMAPILELVNWIPLLDGQLKLLRQSLHS